MNNFNKLTSPQTERLALLAEECGEVIQAIGKIFRHGYKSSHPNIPDRSNKEDLEKEIGHIKCAMGFLYENDDIQEERVNEYWLKKQFEVQKYLHHQGSFFDIIEGEQSC